jgi:hypothetical protein
MNVIPSLREVERINQMKKVKPMTNTIKLEHIITYLKGELSTVDVWWRYILCLLPQTDASRRTGMSPSLAIRFYQNVYELYAYHPYPVLPENKRDVFGLNLPASDNEMFKTDSEVVHFFQHLKEAGAVFYYYEWSSDVQNIVPF